MKSLQPNPSSSTALPVSSHSTPTHQEITLALSSKYIKNGVISYGPHWPSLPSYLTWNTAITFPHLPILSPCLLPYHAHRTNRDPLTCKSVLLHCSALSSLHITQNKRLEVWQHPARFSVIWLHSSTLLSPPVLAVSPFLTGSGHTSLLGLPFTCHFLCLGCFRPGCPQSNPLSPFRSLLKCLPKVLWLPR